MTCGAIEFIWPLASQAIAIVAARLELDEAPRRRAARRRAAGRRRSPGRSSAPRRPWATRRLRIVGGAKRSPYFSSALSSRSRIVSRPSTSAFMNGGSRPRRGSRPAPAIIPKSMSRWVATPSSRTSAASTKVLSASSSTSSSMSGSASPVEVRVARRCRRSRRRRSWRRACRRRRACACPRARRSGRRRTSSQVLGDVQHGVEAEQVDEEVRPHRDDVRPRRRPRRSS